MGSFVLRVTDDPLVMFILGSISDVVLQPNVILLKAIEAIEVKLHCNFMY